MNLAGIVPCSLVDFPGRPSVVIFTQGCNWRCPYCHNRDLMSLQRAGTVTEEDVVRVLQSRPKAAQNLVVTGGEPTLQPDLLGFLRRFRSITSAIKLDTNGSNPEVLQAILEEELVDYVAMDMKAPLDRYEEITGRSEAALAVRKSVEVLKADRVDYEFRTTVIPSFHELDDVLSLAQEVAGGQRLVLQPYEPEHAAHSVWRKLPATTPAFLNDCAAQTREVLPTLVRL